MSKQKNQDENEILGKQLDTYLNHQLFVHINGFDPTDPIVDDNDNVDNDDDNEILGKQLDAYLDRQLFVHINGFDPTDPIDSIKIDDDNDQNDNEKKHQ